jgi:hypothetical protein
MHALWVWIGQANSGVWIYWASVAVLAPLMGWLLRAPCSLPARQWTSAWIALLVADAWALAGPLVQVRSDREIYSPSACVHSLVERRTAHPQDHWRVLDRGLQDLPSSSPLGGSLSLLKQVELEPLLGYNSFDVLRYKQYLAFIADQREPVRPREGAFGFPIVTSFPIQNKSLLDLLGTRYLLQPSDSTGCFAGAGEPGTHRSWRRTGPEDPAPSAYSFLAGGVQSLPPYVVFENQDALPRAFVVHCASPLAEGANVVEQLKQTDFRREVLLEAFAGEHSSGAQLHNDFGEASITRYNPNYVRVQTNALGPGYLVLTDLWFPGWCCAVDGQWAQVHRANYAFRAVCINAGNHEVVFRFSPQSYRLGKCVTVASAVTIAYLCTVCTALSFLRRRRRSRLAEA